MLAGLWGWLNRKRGAIVRGIVRQIQPARAIPFCRVDPAAAGFVPPADFSIGQYPGLIAWHLTKDPAGPKIVSYWQDEPHYLYSRTSFESKLGLGAIPGGWGGAAGDVHSSKVWWWPSSVQDAPVAAAALIGAITVIWSAGTWTWHTLASTPKTEVYFAVSKLDLMEGQTEKVAVNARNATPSAAIDLLATDSAVVNPGDPLVVHLDPSEFHDVAPGAVETLTATVQAPHWKPGHAHAPPDRYRLAFSATGSTFGRTGATSTSELPMTVWPRSFGWTRQLERVAQKPSELYSVRGTLYSGRAFPNGVRGTARLRVPESADLRVDVLPPFRRLPGPPPSAGPGPKTILMDFASPALDKFAEYPFQLMVLSAHELREGWDAVSVEVIFEEGEE